MNSLAAYQEFENKKFALMNLKPGSLVKLTNGQTAEFTRLMNKNFTGTIDGQATRIPIEMFVEVISKAEPAQGCQHMKKGDLFYIVKGRDYAIFKFDHMESGGAILAINPLGNVKTHIPISLFAGLVSDLK